METASILIIGTGALATLFANRLAATGVEVSMLGTWSEGLNALRERGARLIGLDGVEHTYPVRVVENPMECCGARLGFVLVKSWQTERAARHLAACLHEEGLALTLQNGLGNREVLVDALDAQRVAIGVTTIGAMLVAPGLARLGGEGPVSIETHPRLARMAALLRGAGFPVNVVEDARSLVWGKLMVSAAINPLTALLRVTNGELLNKPTARLLMGALAVEAAQVARALGVCLQELDPGVVAEEVARRTAINHSSMLQDVLRGAPTEIETICGAIVRAGEQAGVPTPVNRVMWLLVKAVVG